MTSIPLDRLEKVQADPKKEYRALLRSLRYTEGFGLLFVRCSPAEGNRLVAKVREDLPHKEIEVLSLTEPVETLYDKVDQIYRQKGIDVLFVQGIEHSLYDYEKHRLWSDDAERLNYAETGIPRLLQHLNLGREKFHDSFPFHFIFLVPSFVLKYLIRRAPDFFDWNSGVLEFSMDQVLLLQESEQAIFERFLTGRPLDVTSEYCQKSVLAIQALLEEPNQSKKCQLDLLFEQVRLFYLTENWEAAITSLDRLLQINPGEALAWNNKGVLLSILERYEEAIIFYDKALQFKSGESLSWLNRGEAFNKLGRYEEAIASFEKAIEHRPNYSEAWIDRGISFDMLGKHKEAIDSYDKAIEYEPNNPDSWALRGIALLNTLERYEEAILSFDKALELNPSDSKVFYNKACCYALQSNLQEAIANLSQAILIDPEHRELAKIDFNFDTIRDKEEFQALIAEL
jgi:tetratricopeptide (TPR) repeat protein